MSSDERKIRLSIAMEIIEKVHSDLCNDIEISREMARELCDIIIKLNNFNNKIN